MTKEYITWRCDAKTMWRLIQSTKMYTCKYTCTQSFIFKLSQVKAHSKRSNMLVKHRQRLSNICWTQHFWPTRTAQSNMLDSVGRCWPMLDEVWTNFSSNIVQHFCLWDQNYTIILCLVLKSNIVGWCWIRSNTTASNTIQHWSNTIQHHLTMLDNVWPTCLICLNEPLECNLQSWVVMYKEQNYD